MRIDKRIRFARRSDAVKEIDGGSPRVTHGRKSEKNGQQMCDFG